MGVVITVLAVVVMIIVVVGFHELGHFSVAKWVGIRVDEFAIGFGPKLFGRRRGETQYSVRALPLGGYVRMPGMSALEQHDAGDRAFNRASIPRRMAVTVAGVLANFLLAGLLYSIVSIPGQQSAVVPAAALAQGGLHSGDVIVAVDGRAIDRNDPAVATDQLHAATDSSAGRPATVRYLTSGSCAHVVGHDGDRSLCEITVAPYLQVINLNSDNSLPQQFAVDTINGAPVRTGDPAGLFGPGSVAITAHTLDTPPRHLEGTVSGVTVARGNGDIGRIEAAWRFGYGAGYDTRNVPAAVATGFGRVPREIAGTFSGLWQIFTTPHGGGAKNLQGPVGIASGTADAAHQGLLPYVEWMAFISLNLGIVNILPIPFLDGGRFLLLIIEAVRRRAMDPRRELTLIVAGMALMALLVLFITIGDLGKHS